MQCTNPSLDQSFGLLLQLMSRIYLAALYLFLNLQLTVPYSRRFCRSNHVVVKASFQTNIDGNDDYCRRFRNVANLYGEDSMLRLREAHVCVIGLGGVGGWATEALARSGVGAFTLIDMDDVCISNINRQVFGTKDIGRLKADALREQILDINPYAEVEVILDFVGQNNYHAYLNATSVYNVVLEAADGVSDKAAIIDACTQNNLPVITSGGVRFIFDFVLKISSISFKGN